jgi:polyribonucleotide nucleotidyltransferase
VKAVTDILKEGDELMVKVLEVDRQGKIRLSRKALLEAEGPEEPRHHGKKPDRVSKKHSS